MFFDENQFPMLESIILSLCHLYKNFSHLLLHTCLQLGSYQVCHLLILLYLLVLLPFTQPLVFLCPQPRLILLFHLSPQPFLPFMSPSLLSWIYLLLLWLLHLNPHLPFPLHVLSSCYGNFLPWLRIKHGICPRPDNLDFVCNKWVFKIK